MAAALHQEFMPSYVIVDAQTRRRHVPRAWATEAEAIRERAILLAQFPLDHEWRARLQIVATDRAPRRLGHVRKEKP